MVAEAVHKGEDAIVGIRFITAEVGQTCFEILAFGTAVKLEKENENNSYKHPSSA